MPVRSDDYMQARRDEILDAALICINRCGISNLSLSLICEEAKLSKGALYTHFTSKQEILLALLRRQRPRIHDRIRFEDAASLRRVLHELLGQIDAGRKNAANISDMDAVVVSRNNEAILKELRKTSRERTRVFADSFALLQARGEIRADLDAATAAMLLDVVTIGMIMHSVTQPRDIGQSYKRIVELLLELLEVPD